MSTNGVKGGYKSDNEVVRAGCGEVWVHAYEGGWKGGY